MKILDLLATANHNLLKNKLRTILTIVAIFIGALTLSLTNGLGSGAKGYINDQLQNIAPEDTMEVRRPFPQEAFGSLGDVSEYDPEGTESISPNTFFLTRDDLIAIEETEGVTSVTPVYQITTEYITRTGEGRYSIIVGQYIDEMQLALAAGELLAPQDDAGLILPKRYVEPLGLSSPEEAIGRTVTVGFLNGNEELVERDLSIRGIAEESLLGSFQAYASSDWVAQLHAVQTVNNPALALTFPAAFVRAEGANEEELAAVQERITAQGYAAQTVADQLGQVNNVLNVIQIGLNVFGAIALLAATFGIINTLLMAVYERTREIGLMKALGMHRRQIFLLFALEALSIGFWGGALGILASVGIGLIANTIASNTFLESFEGFDLLAFPIVSSLGILAIVMVVSFLAGVLPALRASRVNPIEALRYE
ncbi:MAG: FtsX-like permease family protein [Candidatus Spechtbacterales bacterium]